MSTLSAYYGIRTTTLDGTTVPDPALSWSQETNQEIYRLADPTAIGRLPIVQFTRANSTQSIAPYGARIVARARGTSENAQIGIIPYKGQLNDTPVPEQVQKLGPRPTLPLWAFPGDEIWLFDVGNRDLRVDLFVAPQNNRETDNAIDKWGREESTLLGGSAQTNAFRYIELDTSTLLDGGFRHTLVGFAGIDDSQTLTLPTLADVAYGDVFEVSAIGASVSVSPGPTSSDPIDGFTLPPSNNLWRMRAGETVSFRRVGDTWTTSGGPRSYSELLINGASVVSNWRGQVYAELNLGAAGQITLPAASTLPDDVEFIAWRTGGADPTIAAAAGTINGLANFILSPNDGVRLIKSGLGTSGVWIATSRIS